MTNTQQSRRFMMSIINKTFDHHLTKLQIKNCTKIWNSKMCEERPTSNWNHSSKPLRHSYKMITEKFKFAIIPWCLFFLFIFPWVAGGPIFFQLTPNLICCHQRLGLSQNATYKNEISHKHAITWKYLIHMEHTSQKPLIQVILINFWDQLKKIWIISQFWDFINSM